MRSELRRMQDMRQMRIRLLVLAALVAALALAFPGAAFADSSEDQSGGTNYWVTFTADGKMTDDFKANQWDDVIAHMQPGDTVTFTVNLKHEHATTCDWYMSNEVIKSLEEGAAKGSAYSYLLTFTSPNSNNTRELYNSTTVGGDTKDNDREGLREATSGLEDFFFLDSLKKNQVAQVKLVVGLDGETEGNAYFDTLAQLKMKFAVELPTKDSSSTKPSPSNSRTTVQTGDDTNLFPFYVIMAVSGALLLALALFLTMRRRKQATSGAHTR